MKKLLFLFSTILLLSIIACSSSTKEVYGPPDNNPKQLLSLEDRLLRKPGVFIQNGMVRIRGGDQSFFGNSEPLFEINGQAVTGGFAAVNQMVSAMDIKSIRVLKSNDELAIYGTRGLNGVIKIKLKKGVGDK